MFTYKITTPEPRIHIARASLNSDFRAHSHDYMEFVVVFHGVTAHRSILGVQTLRAGDVIALRPGAWHAYDDCRHFQYVVCAIAPELLSRELAWTLHEPAIGELLWNGPLAPSNKGIIIFHIEVECLKRCRRLLEQLHQLTRKATNRRPAPIIATVLMFLDALAYQYASARRLGAPPPPHPAVPKVIQLLEADLQHPWTRRELGARVYVDPAHLSRLFKRATGLPPLHYLARLRAERAASLLIHTDKSVGDIGVEVGWPEPFYFARRFRAYFGMAAKEYRRRFLHGRAE